MKLSDIQIGDVVVWKNDDLLLTDRITYICHIDNVFDTERDLWGSLSDIEYVITDYYLKPIKLTI